MKKFEHRLLKAHARLFRGINYEELNDQLNQLGAQGWEVVAVTENVFGNGFRGSLFTLKREIAAK